MVDKPFDGKDITLDATKDTKELDAAANRVLKEFNKGKINLWGVKEFGKDINNTGKESESSGNRG